MQSVCAAGLFGAACSSCGTACSSASRPVATLAGSLDANTLSGKEVLRLRGGMIRSSGSFNAPDILGYALDPFACEQGSKKGREGSNARKVGLRLKNGKTSSSEAETPSVTQGSCPS